MNYADVFEAVEAAFNAEVTEFNAVVGLGYGLVALGAGSILASVLVLVSTPSDEEAVQVSVGPTGASLRAVF